MIRKEFLLKIALSDTLSSSIQRVSIYADGISDNEKKKFRKRFKDKLNKLQTKYREKISDAEHENVIVSYSRELSTEFAHILECGLPIGVAQKAVNLYLKFLWSLELIQPPPHCPVDSTVLECIGDFGTRWTKMEGIKEYRNIIGRIKEYCDKHAPGKSIAEWECELWNRAKE